MIVVIWILCGVFAGTIAGGKGHGGCSWFLGGILFGPLALIATLGLRDRGIQGFPLHIYFPITCKVYPITYFQNSLFFLGTNQDHQKVKSPTAAMGVGLSETSKEVISTERVGFEPTRVLPLHDFESCAINRTLPPLHTP